MIIVSATASWCSVVTCVRLFVCFFVSRISIKKVMGGLS